MKRIEVKTGRPYDVLVGRGLIGQTGQIVAQLQAYNRCVLVSDSNIYPIYGKQTADCLVKTGMKVFPFVFPAGERSKTLHTTKQLYQFLNESQITRGDLIVALGGGVCGDLAGFAAATYLRGIDFVQIPTTLLAQIDSSVGGKTGVNLEQGKNLVGAFYQPRVVICDPDLLESLPEACFIDGLGELLKYALIHDAELFETLLTNGGTQNVEQNIISCIECKRDIVEQDEFEAGRRMVLNFGHTIGHAIEQITGYQSVSHGRAVAIGMRYAAMIGESLGVTPQGTTKQIIKAAQKLGLPTATEQSADALFAALLSDKKRIGQSIRFVLLCKIGEAVIQDIDLDEFKRLLREAAG